MSPDLAAPDVAALAARLDALEAQRTGLAARLDALEAERAVLATLYAYGHAIDAGDERGWLDLFTADGRFSAGGEGQEQFSFDVAGQADLAAFIARHSRRPWSFHAHLVIEPRISVEGAAARCTSYFVVIVNHEATPRIRAFGRYEDVLARGDDARWRFRHRHAILDGSSADVPAPAYNHAPDTAA